MGGQQTTMGVRVVIVCCVSIQKPFIRGVCLSVNMLCDDHLCRLNASVPCTLYQHSVSCRRQYTRLTPYIMVSADACAIGYTVHPCTRCHACVARYLLPWSVCPSVRHHPVLRLNGWTYHRNSFITRWPRIPVFYWLIGVAKFRRDHSLKRP